MSQSSRAGPGCVPVRAAIAIHLVAIATSLTPSRSVRYPVLPGSKVLASIWPAGALRFHATGQVVLGARTVGQMDMTFRQLHSGDAASGLRLGVIDRT